MDVNLKFNKPELVIEIDRDKARASGVTVRDIADALQLYSADNVWFFYPKWKQYYVIGQADRPYRDDPDDLKTLRRSSNGNLVDLGSLIKNQ